ADGTRAWRPFHGEAVADQPCRVEIALQRERAHPLAAGLAYLAEIDRLARRRMPGFFGELAAGGGQRVFAGRIFALGDRPRAVIAIAPPWPAGVYQQHLDVVAAAAIEQQSCAEPGHPAGW